MNLKDDGDAKVVIVGAGLSGLACANRLMEDKIPFQILNGDGIGCVNSLTVPSIVAPTYAPDGSALISVVVIGDLSMEKGDDLKYLNKLT